jgi:hypothetical protein
VPEATGLITLDRRSYFGLTRARFTAVGSGEPRRAFRRIGTVSRDLRGVLAGNPRGRAGVRRYHGILFLGYLCSLLAGLSAGLAAGAMLVGEILAPIEPSRMTVWETRALHALVRLPTWRTMAIACIPLFLLAVALDVLAWRSILGTVDSVSPVPPVEPVEETES